MHDNPQPVPAPVFALPDHHVVPPEGADAVAFAQSQFMNDVAALADGQWQWSGWLTPKGRVIALFRLLRLSAERVALVVADADADAFAAALSRFVFRAKVKVAVRADLPVAGTFHSSAARDAAIVENAGAIELDSGTELAARTLLLGAVETNEDHKAVARWRRFDLIHGLPRLDASQQEQWTPQQLSLERLSAYSVRKGCYPGQEIVARTHFLGKAKRGLVLLDADADVPAGTQVFAADGTPLGAVVSTATFDGQACALAVVPLERDAAAVRAGDVAVRERPLLDGLAR